MVTDALDPVGIYFGTRSGKVYASRDAGKSWKELLNGLPQIVCVASAVVGESAGPRSRVGLVEALPTRRVSEGRRPTKKGRRASPRSGVGKRKGARATKRKKGRR